MTYAWRELVYLYVDQDEPTNPVAYAAKFCRDACAAEWFAETFGGRNAD